MITTAFLLLLAAAAALAFNNWRRAILLVVICGILQDPVRKLTPGNPPLLTYSVMPIFLLAVIAARREIVADTLDLASRFPRIAVTAVWLAVVLVLQLFNGLSTYGLEYWKVPALSLITYLAPAPAVLLAYSYLRREELLWSFFRAYSFATSIALIGTIFEYFRVPSKALGLVAYQGDYIRHMPGVQIRMLAGIYRAPDVMAWHAATLTCIAIGMILARGVSWRALPWFGAAAWGFLNCMLSGRRKALMYLAVFLAVLVWRYSGRLVARHVSAVAGVALVIGVTILSLAGGEGTRSYAAGAGTTQAELLRRLEGGMFETFRQSGLFGLGLGAATQGIQHVSGGRSSVGWQEGGLAKIAVELGLPGMLCAFALAAFVISLGLTLTRIGDVRGTSQIGRVILFALVMGNAANFAGSAQAYTDPVLTIVTATMVGWLLASSTLDERLATPQQLRPPVRAVPASMA